MTITRDEIIAIIKQEVECNPYADFKSDMLVGVEDAADTIMARLESPFGKYGDPEISDDCEFCCGASDCPSKWDGWLCTRELGHTGDHVACGGRGFHSKHTWLNKQDSK